MDDEERKKYAKEISQGMKAISDDLVKKGYDPEELRKMAREELEIMRAMKKAEKSTKH